MSGEEASLSPLLLSVLVDPVDHGPLWYFAGRALLYNARTRTVYVVTNQIPVMLESEARTLSESEAAELDELLDQAIETGGRSLPGNS